jgi:hypothetical protein
MVAHLRCFACRQSYTFVRYLRYLVASLFLSALNISSLALTYRKDRRTFVPRQVTKIHELMRAFATREVARQRQRQAAVRASRWGAAIKCQPIAILSHSCDGFSFAIGSTWDIFPHMLAWEKFPHDRIHGRFIDRSICLL